MMAVLEAILSVVGRSSGLALELYRVAALCQDEAVTDLIKAASVINNFASILKQIGTIIKEDDRLLSHEAIETLENLIEQSQSISSEIEALTTVAAGDNHGSGGTHLDNYGLSRRESSRTTRFTYLTSHLEALKATLSVLLQTLYTAQIIIWSKYRPTISPQQAEKAVINEKRQLEALITEQQVLILSALSAYEKAPLSDSLLLMEADSSQSLMAAGREEMPSPANLSPYQIQHLVGLDRTSSNPSPWLVTIRSISASQIESLLKTWTCLPQLETRLRDAEREVRMQQRESQQPMVESDSEDEQDQRRKRTSASTRNTQPLFMEANTFSHPKKDAEYGPTAPLSPAATPRNSRDSLGAPSNEQDSRASPRSSITSLPVEAAAAVEAKEEDEDIDLEIPWQLCTRKYYWRYIDGKIISSNTDQLPSVAFLERNSWTEIMASWVCKEAIQEAGYRVTQVQKDTKDGRRTKLETCFCVERPLQFDQVKRLVERTVEIYRRQKPPSPPPQIRRSSFNRPPPPPPKIARPTEIDRDRTPMPGKTHPQLGRSSSSMPIPPAIPPPLDRTMSMPGSGPTLGSQNAPNPRASNLHIPMPPGPYSTSMPHSPYSPQAPQGPYTPQLYSSPQGLYPPNSGFSNTTLPPHLQPHNVGVPQSPLRQSHLNPKARSRYEDDLTTSESDSGKDRRRRRSKSRNRYSAEPKKKSHNKSKAAGVLMGVGGLTALLDGLSGL